MTPHARAVTARSTAAGGERETPGGARGRHGWDVLGRGTVSAADTRLEACRGRDGRDTQHPQGRPLNPAGTTVVPSVRRGGC